jgi:hypothetical protein
MANVNVINAYNTYGVHHHNKVNEQVNNQNAAQTRFKLQLLTKIIKPKIKILKSSKTIKTFKITHSLQQLY